MKQSEVLEGDCFDGMIGFYATLVVKKKEKKRGSIEKWAAKRRSLGNTRLNYSG